MSDLTKISKAITALRPGAIWELRGDTYEDLVWRDESPAPTREEVAAALLLPEPIPVPESVSLRQFRMALKRSGLFATVDGLRTNQALTTQQRDDLTEFLEFSNQIERAHQLIESLYPMVGVTSEQIDDLFRLADTL